MEKKIIQFGKGALYGALDATLSVYPQTAIIWGALKGGYQATRQERATVFVHYIEQNFSIEIFQDEQFVDGLALTFEAYIKQRNKEKRDFIKNVFLGFSNASDSDKENFELERIFDVLNKITPYQISILKRLENVKDTKIVDDNAVNEQYSEYKSLESLGLIDIEIHIEVDSEEEMIGDPEDGLNATGGNVAVLTHDQYANLSLFGEEFINHILSV